jgi:hypothetical protein
MLLDLSTDWRALRQKPDQKIFVEIGAGDGRDALTIAAKMPDAVFVAIEPNPSEVVEFLRRSRWEEMEWTGVKNVYVVWAKDHEAFAAQKGQHFVDGIYSIAPDMRDDTFMIPLEKKSRAAALELLNPDSKIIIMPYAGGDEEMWQTAMGYSFPKESGYIVERYMPDGDLSALGILEGERFAIPFLTVRIDLIQKLQ